MNRATVMPGLVPDIHVLSFTYERRTWMTGTSPAMTKTEPAFFPEPAK
jgi:hypothetical protein